MQMKPNDGTHIEEVGVVLDWLDAAYKRIGNMRSESRFRDVDEIWETYCNVEMAIALSKFIVGTKMSSGRIRRVKISGSSDPSVIDYENLERAFALIESEILASKKKLQEGKGGESIELARKARDRLKMMILGRRKNSFKKK